MRTIEKRMLILSAQQVQLGMDSQRGDIVLHFALAESAQYIMPELDIGIRFSPGDAREIGAALIRMADEVEVKPA